MTWPRTDIEWRSTPAGQKPVLLVAILTGGNSPPAGLWDAAAGWARLFPLSTVVIFKWHDDIEARLNSVLAEVRLPPERLLLVGFGEGARISLSLALGGALPCAGVLIYDGLPDVPPAAIAVNPRVRVRIIGHTFGDPRHDDRLGAVVRQLADMGVDVRATQLADLGLTPAAIRLGAAYLAELSAIDGAYPRFTGGN
jgi:hypothetical protein